MSTSEKVSECRRPRPSCASICRANGGSCPRRSIRRAASPARCCAATSEPCRPWPPSRRHPASTPNATSGSSVPAGLVPEAEEHDAGGGEHRRGGAAAPRSIRSRRRAVARRRSCRAAHTASRRPRRTPRPRRGTRNDLEAGRAGSAARDPRSRSGTATDEGAARPRRAAGARTRANDMATSAIGGGPEPKSRISQRAPASRLTWSRRPVSKTSRKGLAGGSAAGSRGSAGRGIRRGLRIGDFDRGAVHGSPRGSVFMCCDPGSRAVVPCRPWRRLAFALLGSPVVACARTGVPRRE